MYHKKSSILGVKRFFIFFYVLLSACKPEHATMSDTESKPNSDITIQNQGELHNCPKMWTDELNNRENCRTNELAGMKFNTCYKDNQRDGLECIYSENGVLYNEVTWKNDNMNGQDIEYYENGNVKKIRTMVENEMHGVAKGFYPNGNLMFDGYYNGFCDVKYGTCYTESGIAVPLSPNDLTNCYNKCEDIIYRELGTKLKQ